MPSSIEIYMRKSICLHRWGFYDKGRNIWCIASISPYTLKQASCQWFAKFLEAICSDGYIQSQADHSLFTKQQGKSFTSLLIYADDILITRNDLISITATKTFLHKLFVTTRIPGP
jgi:hypothetical protein